MDDIKLQAPAKVNLFLAVQGKRPDGYHDLQTLMLKLDLFDTIMIAPSNAGIVLKCPESDLPEDSSNLAFRAAETFFLNTGIAANVEIILEKRIPVAAGLGGGSSDAAAVLQGLNVLHGNPVEPEKLKKLGVSLGADVPFFLSPCRAALAEGIGDILTESVVSEKFWLVLVNPGFPVSTKWVYENFALTTGGNPYILGRKIDREIGYKTFLQGGSLRLYNDLESVTAGKYPEISTLKEELLAAGASGALMSGSGPTVFGLFDNFEAARNCLYKLERPGRILFLAAPYQGHH